MAARSTNRATVLATAGQSRPVVMTPHRRRGHVGNSGFPYTAGLLPAYCVRDRAVRHTRLHTTNGRASPNINA